VTSNTPPSTEAPTSLTLTDVYNGDTLESSDFSIKIIGSVENSDNTQIDKNDFNNTYKNALQAYVNSGDCPNIAKP
jgi:hypothetical protein